MTKIEEIYDILEICTAFLCLIFGTWAISIAPLTMLFVVPFSIGFFLLILDNEQHDRSKSHHENSKEGDKK